MTERDGRIREFVGYLRSLTREGQEDRGALADLRSGLAFVPGHAPRTFRHVVPHLGEREGRDDRWFYVVGTMFGSNPVHHTGMSVGDCFRVYAEEDAEKQAGHESSPDRSRKRRGEARFLALLGSHADDIYSHLYHATGLLKSREIGIDYYRLLQDLMNWDHADRRVQNQWARDYYRPREKDNSNQEEQGEEDAE
jgi:CRISPR type I-E-associated protein CasB/Cse2